MRWISGLVLVAGGLIGCSGGGDANAVPESPPAYGGGDSTPPAPTDAEPERAPEPEPEAPSAAAWTTGIVEVRRETGVRVLESVRTGWNEGFDRIVFGFGQGALPGYHISYIDRPVRQCGSGDVVPMPGDGWLEIRMQPAAAHTEAGQPTVAERVRMLQLPNLKQLTSICDFEADVTWVAAVLSPNDFRVYELKDPSRLVVDIRHQ